jgi:hypothetical protein
MNISWDNFFEKELHSLVVDRIPGKGEREREGEPKKGKGRGKGDTNPETPKALEDLPPDEHQTECFKQLKRTGIWCSNA